VSLVAQTKWFTIRSTNGTDEFIECSDEVIIVARNADGRILLIEEPAYAFGTRALLFPGGVAEAGEDLLATALRELREETGFGAGRLKHIATLRPWSKYLRVHSHVVYAEELFHSPLVGDEVDPIALHLRTYAELRQMIAAGEIMDARVIAAVSMCFDAEGEPGAK
jgi:8-oxo-dGTP pyrophosphatase MutT (NUDIX family)